MLPMRCGNCGADINTTARFCRQCGAPLSFGEPSIGPLEATTRTLDAPSSGPGTNPQSLAPTAYQYVPPDQLPLPAPRQSNGKVIALILGAMAVLIMALVAALGLMVNNVSHRLESRNPPDSTAPPPPLSDQRVQAPPQLPTLPANPPKPAADSKQSGTLADLVYPGANVNMSVQGNGDEGMLKLTTADDADKVAAWYLARLPGARQIRTPGPVAILTSNRAKVVITGVGHTTMIVVTKSGD